MAETNPNTPPVGDKDPNPVDSDLKNTDNKENETVRYSSYQKILSEKKNLMLKHSDALEKLAQYESKESELRERQQIEDKQFETVIGEKNTEIDTLNQRLSQSEQEKTDFRKMHGFLSGLGASRLESKYYSLVDLDKINVDDTGSLDQESVANAVSEFKTEHHRLIIDPKNDLPANSVDGSKSTGLTVSEWENLGSSKEMRNRAKEVDWSAK